MSKFSGIVEKHKKLGDQAIAQSEVKDERIEAQEGEPAKSKFSGIADKQGKQRANAKTKLEFNNEPIDIHKGETLVQAARRHGSFVWFLCDGRGICQTCECRVISGEENLSELAKLERAALGENQRRKGYRLGCQAHVVGSGSVSVVSRAEELRRRARDVLSDSKGRSLWDRLQGLGVDSLSATVDLVTGMTRVTPQAIPQILKFLPTPAGVANYVLDTFRLAGNLWSSGIRTSRKTSDSKS